MTVAAVKRSNAEIEGDEEDANHDSCILLRRRSKAPRLEGADPDVAVVIVEEEEEEDEDATSVDCVHASRVLAWMWRHVFATRKTTFLVECLLHTHRVQLAELRTGTFDEACSRLSDPLTLRALRDVLVRFVAQSNAAARSQLGANAARPVSMGIVNAQWLAFGYLVTAFPDKMGEHHKCRSFKGVEETARRLVAAFESLCRYYDKTRERDLVPFGKIGAREAPRFHRVYRGFVRAYRAWRMQGDAKLVVTIKAKMISMQRSLIILEGTRAYDADALRELLQDHLVTMEHRLKALVDRSDFAEFMAKLHSPASMCAAGGGRGGPAVGQWAEEEDGTPGPGGGAQQHKEGAIPPEEMRYVQRPTLMTFDQITHELLIDARFTIDEDGHNPYTPSLSMRDTFGEAFWADLKLDMQGELKVPVRLACVLSELHHSLQDMGFSKEADAFQGAFDFAETRAWLQGGLRDWEAVVRPFADFFPVLLKTVRPFRQEACEASWRILEGCLTCSHGADFEEKVQAYCECLRFFTNCVHLSRVDGCRTAIRILRAIAPKCGAECIRSQFMRRVNAGTTSLTLTSAWLRQAAPKEEILSNSLCADSSGLLWEHQPGRAHAIMRIHATACSRLIVGAMPNESICPETFAFDIGRLRDLCRRLNIALDGYALYLRARKDAALDEGQLDLFGRALCKHGGDLRAVALAAPQLPIRRALAVPIDAEVRRVLRYQVGLAFVSSLVRQAPLHEALLRTCTLYKNDALLPEMLEGIYTRFARVVQQNLSIFEPVYANVLDEHLRRTC